MDFCGKKILVTGASGFLGARLLPALIKCGFEVSALTRFEKNAANLSSLGAAPVIGDVAERKSLLQAFADIDYVVHAAADTSGTIESGQRTTIEGTKNVLHMCREFQVTKLVYISSCSVYGIADRLIQDRVDEKFPLESQPEKRGAYSWAKLEADKLVLKFIDEGSVATVCLRPGMIYGLGGELYSPMLGFSCKNKLFVVIGSRHFILPLVYVDNLVDAIIVALSVGNSDGEVFNVVDGEQIDKQRYMKKLISRLYPGAKYFYFPYQWLEFIVIFQELLFKLIHKKPYLSRYRLQASQQSIVYDTTKIQKQLGWRQKVTFDEAVQQILNHQLIE